MARPGTCHVPCRTGIWEPPTANRHDDLPAAAATAVAVAAVCGRGEGRRLSVC